MIDAIFPVMGETVPADHLFPLYGALSACVPLFHATGSPLRFAPLTGSPAGSGLLGLRPGSHLRVRLPPDHVREVLPLAGKTLDIAGHRVRIGVPSMATLIPAAAVQSRVVTFHTEARDQITPEPFLATARTQLAALGIDGEPSIPLALSGPRAGEAKRKVVRIHGTAIVGYALRVSGLTAEHSLKLQERALGGRTKIGYGFFLPVREGR